MENELNIDGLGISIIVLETIINHAVTEVEGVAGIGGGNIVRTTKARFGSDRASSTGIEVGLSDNAFDISIRMQARYGYRLTEVANNVREAVNNAIMSQVGIGVNYVDIHVDGIVFPVE